MFDRVFALYRRCAYLSVGLLHASGPTGPRNKEFFFVVQIVDPGIIEIMLLHKESQTLPLKNPTSLKLYFEHVSFS